LVPQFISFIFDTSLHKIFTHKIRRFSFSRVLGWWICTVWSKIICKSISNRCGWCKNLWTSIINSCCWVCNSGMAKVSKLRYRSLTGNLLGLFWNFWMRNNLLFDQCYQFLEMDIASISIDFNAVLNYADVQMQSKYFNITIGNLFLIL